MDRLRAILATHRDAILQMPNVVGVGIGNKRVRGVRRAELAVVVLVEKKLPVSQLPRAALVPRDLDGAPTDVIEVGVLRPLRATAVARKGTKRGATRKHSATGRERKRRADPRRKPAAEARRRPASTGAARGGGGPARRRGAAGGRAAGRGRAAAASHAASRGGAQSHGRAGSRNGASARARTAGSARARTAASNAGRSAGTRAITPRTAAGGAGTDVATRPGRTREARARDARARSARPGGASAKAGRGADLALRDSARHPAPDATWPGAPATPEPAAPATPEPAAPATPEPAAPATGPQEGASAAVPHPRGLPHRASRSAQLAAVLASLPAARVSLRPSLSECRTPVFAPHPTGVPDGDRSAERAAAMRRLLAGGFVPASRAARALGRGVPAAPPPPLEVASPKAALHRARLRPARPGGSIGHWAVSAGTFGAVVWDARTGEPYILSNNHVLANATTGRDGRARKGDPILQPGPLDAVGGAPAQNGRELVATAVRAGVRAAGVGRSARRSPARAPEAHPDAIARLGRFVPLRLREANLVDAALGEPETPGSIDPEILGVGTPRGVAPARPGAIVRKSGRTTGVTEGEVLAVHAAVRVEYPLGTLAFVDQVVCGPMSGPGDSGSLLVDGANRAVGLLFAGSEQSAICNPIGRVLRMLGVTLQPPGGATQAPGGPSLGAGPSG